MTDRSKRVEADMEARNLSLVERAAARLERGAAQPAGMARDAAARRANGQAAVTGPDAGTMSAPASPSVRVDLERLAAKGYLTPDRMRTGLAEEMRMVKRTLLQRCTDRTVPRSNLVLVTSAWPREGKSFVCLNLAMSMACELDLHVLLVDVDFEHPQVFERLGLRPRPGMMDALVDPELDLGDIIHRTDIERLSVIGAGNRHDMSTELLNSQRMWQITTELSERYDDRIVLFDAGPLLATSEAAVMAELVGQILVVVKAEETTREALEQALDLLPGEAKVSLVLNSTQQRLGEGNIPYHAYRDHRRQDV